MSLISGAVRSHNLLRWTRIQPPTAADSLEAESLAGTVADRRLHHSAVPNGPTMAVNSLIKRDQRVSV